MSELIGIGYYTPETAEAARPDVLGSANASLVGVADDVGGPAQPQGDITLARLCPL